MTLASSASGSFTAPARLGRTPYSVSRRKTNSAHRTCEAVKQELAVCVNKTCKKQGSVPVSFGALFGNAPYVITCLPLLMLVVLLLMQVAQFAEDLGACIDDFRVERTGCQGTVFLVEQQHLCCSMSCISVALLSSPGVANYRLTFLVDGCAGKCGNGPNMKLEPGNLTFSYMATPAKLASMLRSVCKYEISEALLKVSLFVSGSCLGMKGPHKLPAYVMLITIVSLCSLVVSLTFAHALIK